MGEASGEKETQREGMGSSASLATYLYFGICDAHGKQIIDPPGKVFPPRCRCGERIDHNRITRARC